MCYAPTQLWRSKKIRAYEKAFIYTEAAVGAEQIKLAAEKITVFPVADRTSNTFKVRLDLPRGITGLFPGMFVKTSLVTGEKKLLMVPSQSIVYRSEVTAVYVLATDGSINFRHVRIGGVNKNRQIVLSGLTEGETVALDPIKAGVVLMQQRQHSAGQY